MLWHYFAIFWHVILIPAKNTYGHKIVPKIWKYSGNVFFQQFPANYSTSISVSIHSPKPTNQQWKLWMQFRKKKALIFR
jgi:hypothetical protein